MKAKEKNSDNFIFKHDVKTRKPGLVKMDAVNRELSAELAQGFRRHLTKIQ